MTATTMIGEARADLHTLLVAAAPTGTSVHDHVPEDLDGLDITIQPGRPPIRVGTLAGAYEVRFTVCVLISGEDNAEVHSLVDDHLSALVPAVSAGGWELDDATLTDIRTIATSEWTSYGVLFDVTRLYTPPAPPEE